MTKIISRVEMKQKQALIANVPDKGRTVPTLSQKQITLYSSITKANGFSLEAALKMYQPSSVPSAKLIAAMEQARAISKATEEITERYSNDF